VLTVSQASIRQLKSKGVLSEKIKVIHNAVPQGFGCVGGRELSGLRASLGLRDEQKVILSVGRLSKEKDHLTLIDALSFLPGQQRPSLLIVGEGPEQKAIMDRVRALGLLDRVIMLGQKEYIEPFYAIADVVVISSHSEGSPNVLLEALAAGVPVVATAVGGIPEMVTDGEDAILVEDGDAKKMAACIDRVLRTTNLAQSLVSRGKKLIQTRFSPQERAQNLSEIYSFVRKSHVRDRTEFLR